MLRLQIGLLHAGLLRDTRRQPSRIGLAVPRRGYYNGRPAIAAAQSGDCNRGCPRNQSPSFRSHCETIMNRIISVPALLVVLGLSVAQAADIRRISLEGQEGVPAPAAEPGQDGIDRIHKVETPALELFPTTQKPARGTIMICPGGGYGILAINHEGYFVAKKLNEFGYDAAILLYHVSAGKQTLKLAFADAKAGARAAAKARQRVRAQHEEGRRDGLLGGRAPRGAADPCDGGRHAARFRGVDVSGLPGEGRQSAG